MTVIATKALVLGRSSILLRSLPKLNCNFEAFSNQRCLSSLIITKNIELITKDNKQGEVDKFKIFPEREKPLVVLLQWLMARRKNMLKYANIYLDKGFDVLNVHVSPWQLMWPTKGVKLVAADFLRVLEANPAYKPLLLHGFSVGGYVWGEILVHAHEHMQRYDQVLNRFVGQVWDSAVDVTGMHNGVAVSLFPRNVAMQNAMKKFIAYHLKAFNKVATCHYIRASQMFHTNKLKSPALFIVSKSDPIGEYTANKRAYESWVANGIQADWQCFEKSPHVGHMRFYQKEYLAAIDKLLQRINLKSVQQSDKIRASR